tara:strand:- start:177 stop:1325 length:1149 start_codon:yes stop_codon:yes gene_type:complete
MKKQKICIIGGGLTGLVTAISLSKFDFEIDLITGNLFKNFKSGRTIAISESNFNFLNKLNISESLKKKIWVCSKMKLYTESYNENFLEVFEINKENKNENIFYMLENSKIMKLMLNKIKKIKSISLKKNKKISSIYTSGILKNLKFNKNVSKYNLVIISTGHENILIKKLFNDKIIKNSYKEFAITTIIQHSPINNIIARQIFLDDGIFAMLPISKDKTSIVLSIKNSMKIKSDYFFKEKIKKYASNYLKNLKFISRLEKKDLNLMLRKKYYSERTLLFGDALHVMHPFVGQSFNMTLRDLKCLEKIIREKINLGLDIGGSDVLSEFSSETKPLNFSFALGSDLLKSGLAFKKTRNDIFKILNKSNFAKDIVFDVANKGFRF